jgi:hypothetical protein
LTGTTIRSATYSGPEEVIEKFAEWRLKWYTTRFQKMVADASYELIYWKVLKALSRMASPSGGRGSPTRRRLEEDVDEGRDQEEDHAR